MDWSILGYVAKIAPCLVLSIRPLDTDRALATVIPHTTSPEELDSKSRLSLDSCIAGVFDAQNPTSDSSGETDAEARQPPGGSTGDWSKMPFGTGSVCDEI